MDKAHGAPTQGPIFIDFMEFTRKIGKYGILDTPMFGILKKNNVFILKYLQYDLCCRFLLEMALRKVTICLLQAIEAAIDNHLHLQL